MSRVLAWAWVPGHPRTKGSLDPRKGGGLTDSAASKRWRAQLVSAVRAARSAAPRALKTSQGPIAIEALCFEPLSAAERAITYEDNGWLPVATAPNQSNGDLDKLLRNLLDALAVDLVSNDQRKGADVFTNDAQVVEIHTHKLIEIDPHGAGILVRVTEQDPADVALIRQHAANMLWCAERGFLPDGEIAPRFSVNSIDAPLERD